MKLLIIDDDPDALEVAKSRLAKERVEILCAEGGIAGLEVARRERPDLILLDLEMPDMSGLDVCRALKSDVELCMIPVLFLTGSSTAEDKVRGLDLGAVDYITKPFDAFELRARVRAALRTKHLQDLLIEHAHIDPLTGLPNRRALMERLQSEWARIRRHGGRLSFIMADIDHFKRVNDAHGHHIGDKLLQEVAQAIVRQCREVDLPARYGGEEFAIVVPHETESGAVRLAERCRQEIAKAGVSTNGGPVRVTASFGVADATSAPSPEALIKRADEALYRAKQSGRNAVEGYDGDAVGKTHEIDLSQVR
jgi:diguanylate cyclase (GGDEF)-like protein